MEEDVLWGVGNFPSVKHTLLHDLQIPPQDIRWGGEENGATLNAGHGGGMTRGSRRTLSNGGLGRVPMTQPRRDHLVIAQNGGGRKFFDEIELFNTDSLVKEV